MATYWFVIDDLDIWKAQKSEVRQAAKDVVKSEVCKGIIHRQPLITLSMSGKDELKKEP